MSPRTKKNKQWVTDDGKRWQRAERIAVARLFRGHVDTPSNRRRGKSCRIQRRGCFWHPDVEAEAHHVNYSRPFVVVWVGVVCGCHRRVEHGSLKVPKAAIFDYTSLIEGPYGISRPTARQKGKARRAAEAEARAEDMKILGSRIVSEREKKRVAAPF